MRLFRSILLAATLAISCASASTVMSVTGIDQTRGANIWLTGDGILQETYAGSIVISLDGVSTLPVLCVDLFAHINIGDQVPVAFTLPADIDPADASRGLRAAYLFVTQFSQITNAVDGAGLQLAVWDIIHDGGDGLSVGRIQASTTVGQATDTAIRDAAIHYIQVALNYTPVNATVYRDISGPGGKQPLLGGWMDPNSVATPEPSSLALAGCGIVLFGLQRFRSKRK